MSAINEKFHCDCGSKIKNQPANIRAHLKSKKHINFLNNKEKRMPLNEDAKKEYDRLRMREVRRKQRELLGEEKYKEIERNRKRRYRKEKKEEKKEEKEEIVKGVDEDVNKGTQSFKNNVDFAIFLTELINKLERKNTPREEVKEIAEEEIRKFDISQGNIISCDYLKENLSRKHLVNDKYQNIEQKTIDDYLKNIKSVYEAYFGSEWDCQDWDWLRDAEKIVNVIRNMKTKAGKITALSTQTKRITSILSVLDRIDGFEDVVKEYRRLQNQSQVDLNKQRDKNLLSVRENRNFMDWKDIKNYTSEIWTDEDKLLHSLYTSIPPRRNTDYAYLKLARHKSLPQTRNLDKDYNYIVTNKNDNPIAIVINRYKTSKKYGQFVINLTNPDQKPNFVFSDIRKLSKSLIKNENMKHGDLFFPDTKGKSYGQAFNTRVNYIFKDTGKIIGVDILRHSYITNFLEKNNLSKTSDKTLKLISSYLGHSPSMFLSYRKLDNNKVIDEFIKEEKE